MFSALCFSVSCVKIQAYCGEWDSSLLFFSTAFSESNCDLVKVKEKGQEREREREREIHFLFHCEKFSSLRDLHFGKIAKKIANFPMLTSGEKLAVLLGEGTAAPHWQLNLDLPATA